MTRKKKPDTDQSKAGDAPSRTASAPEDAAPDTQTGTQTDQGATPKTGPYAHDPARVSAPENPAKRLPQSDPSPATVADAPASQATEPETAPETSDAAPGMTDTATDPEADRLAPDTPEDPGTPEDTGIAAATPGGSVPESTAAEDTATEGTAPGADTSQAARADARPGAAPAATGETVTIRQGGFWSMLFGGALAASIGVVASPYILSSEMLEGRVPAFLAPNQEGGDEVETQLADQGGRLDEIETRLDDLSGDIQTAMDRPDPPPDLSDEVEGLSETIGSVETRIGEIENRFGTVEDRFADVEGQISDLGNRLTAVEDRPIPTSDDSEVSSGELESLRARLEDQRVDMEAQRAAIEEQRSRIDEQTSALEEQRAAIEEQRDTLATQADEVATLREAADAEEAAAQDSARAALQRAALTRVETALDTGSPFADALADLRETDVEVPSALADTAETGVPTQTALIDAFPDAARAALSRVRDTRDTNDGLGAVEIGEFFRNQLGMRSLVPREGDGVDAILSRAEAALRDARIDDALAEVENLPEDARAALDDWVARATQRQEALSAADALADRLN